MQLQKQKSRKKPLIITLLIVLCVAVTAGVWYFLHARSQQSESYTTKPATQQEKDAGAQTKQDSINNSNQSGTSDTSTNSDKQSGASTDTGSSASAPTTNITVSASAQNGSTYQIRFLISSVVTGGNCQLTLTKGSATVTKQAAVQSLAQSSTCQGFDIPTSELSTGTWNVAMQLSGSSHTGSATGTIEVK